MEALPVLNLWSQMLYHLCEPAKVTSSSQTSNKALYMKDAMTRYDTVGLDTVDYVPASMPDQSLKASLVMMEDNDAVIKMLKKGRAPALAHVSRTHRVNLDWLLERLHVDPAIWCRYVESRHQLADVLTKPGFTRELWCTLLEQWRIAPPPTPKPKSLPSATPLAFLDSSTGELAKASEPLCTPSSLDLDQSFNHANDGAGKGNTSIISCIQFQSQLNLERMD